MSLLFKTFLGGLAGLVQGMDKQERLKKKVAENWETKKEADDKEGNFVEQLSEHLRLPPDLSQMFESLLLSETRRGHWMPEARREWMRNCFAILKQRIAIRLVKEISKTEDGSYDQMIWLARQKPMHEGTDELASLCRRMGMDYDSILREEVVKEMQEMKKGLEQARSKRTMS